MKPHNFITLNIISFLGVFLTVVLYWHLTHTSHFLWYKQIYLCFSSYTGIFLFLLLLIPELIMRIWKPNLLPQIVYPAKFKILFTVFFYVCLLLAIAAFGVVFLYFIIEHN